MVVEGKEMSLFNRKKKSTVHSIGFKKVFIVTGLLFAFIALAPVVGSPVLDSALGIETAYAASQTDRWESAGGDIWKLKTADKQGYVINSWFQDLDGSWYMIGADGAMLSGLITDNSTGKSYLMNINHDGTFGKMLVANGVYNLNGQQVYLEFDQSHNGSFGAILTGLSGVRGAGVSEKQLASIPTDSSGTAVETTPTTQNNIGLIDNGNGVYELPEGTNVSSDYLEDGHDEAWEKYAY